MQLGFSHAHLTINLLIKVLKFVFLYCIIKYIKINKQGVFLVKIGDIAVSRYDIKRDCVLLFNYAEKVKVVAYENRSNVFYVEKENKLIKCYCNMFSVDNGTNFKINDIVKISICDEEIYYNQKVVEVDIENRLLRCKGWVVFVPFAFCN